MRLEVVQRPPGVEDVIQEQHVTALDVGHQLRRDVQFAGPGHGAAVAAGLDQVDAQGQVQVPHQVGQEHDAAGQDADDGGRPLAEVGGDHFGQLGDALLQALGGDQHFHRRPNPGRDGERSIEHEMRRRGKRENSLQ